MKHNFTFKDTQNCRHFYKRNYTLNKNINSELLNLLEQFGVIEIFEFSKYSKTALDTFKIQLEHQVNIEGVIGGTNLNVTLAKESPSLLSEFEKDLMTWTNKTSSS